MIAALLLLSNPASAQREPDCQDIEQAINAEILFDDAISARAINIECQDGIVTLSGSVEHLLARQRALRIAMTTAGVRAVLNRLEVLGPKRSDDDLRDDLIAALRADSAVEAPKIELEVRSNQVVLRGTVDSWPEKQLAGSAVRGVHGVRSVRNEIKVRGRDSRTDEDIRADIERRFDADVSIDAEGIVVDVQNSEVTLSGIVGSAYAKSRAFTYAWVNGVRAVHHDSLEVDPWYADELRRRDGDTLKNDVEIAKAVADALYYDPRVNDSLIEVHVQFGLVTLSGVVHDLSAKRAARRDALNTVGVRRVKNLLSIQPLEPDSDDNLVHDVRAAIARDAYLHANHIDVRVEDGKVYLSGTVEDAFRRRRATTVALRITGVVGVDNNLDVDLAP